MKGSSDEHAVKGRRQHQKPCSDCPWRRNSLPGWLGEGTVEGWLAIAHGDRAVKCHVVSNHQCAGIAIFRRNICKTPRNPKCLELPANHTTVFSWNDEFSKHHQAGVDPLGDATVGVQEGEG